MYGILGNSRLPVNGGLGSSLPASNAQVTAKITHLSEAMQITELELWHERHAGLLREAENTRLARLLRAEARRTSGTPRKGMAARALAVVVALFR